MQLHTRGTWSARDDRRITLVWLGLFLLFIFVGFGSDLSSYFHEQPSPPMMVHLHAIVATIWLLILSAQIALVEVDNVKLHRKLGWFAAAWAALLVIVAAWGELDQKAIFAQRPEIFEHIPPRSSAFLAISLGGLLCFALLTIWAIVLRKNPAAHRRVMVVANISIMTPGFARLMVNVVRWRPTNPIHMFIFFYLGTLVVLAAMLLWDLKKGRVMRQFLLASAFVLFEEVLSIYLMINPAWHGVARNLIKGWASLKL